MTYQMWAGMVERCHDPEHKDYSYYGARGITVHPRWRDSFEKFATELVAEIGPRPEGHQMDRVDNSKGYRPGNIRFVTAKENANNRRDNKCITHQGETLTAAQWADRTGLPRQQIANRINRGWSAEDALTKPLEEPAEELEIDGERLSVVEWSRRTGRIRTTIHNRIRAGMTPKEAVFGELGRRFDGICPRCRESPRHGKDKYCAPCRRAYYAAWQAKRAAATST